MFKQSINCEEVVAGDMSEVQTSFFLMKKMVVKTGFLWLYSTWRSHGSQMTNLVSSRASFFVLSRSSLDYYRCDKCDKLKGTFPLVLMTNVSVEQGATFRIRSKNQYSLHLRASSEHDCLNWVHLIDLGIRGWDGIPRDRSLKLQDSAYLVRFPSEVYNDSDVLYDDCLDVHKGSTMIKYARNQKSIPHERIVKVDVNNLHVMWKKARIGAEYTLNSAVAIADIVEVRYGQQTQNFSEFPYLEVEKQSFSLMLEISQGIWCGLTSLDLICDSVLAYQQWKHALNRLINGDADRSPLRKIHESFDPVVLFLKRHWSILANKKKETVEQAANLMLKIAPSGSKRTARNLIRNLGKTQHCEDAVSFNCFLLAFNLFNAHLPVYRIYKKYAQMYPELGLTPMEFQAFLTEEQKEQDVSLASCANLISFHDSTHLLLKQLLSGDDPDAYHRSRLLMSFHGFVSFLRSKDNSVFNIRHQEVYQNMDQPLAHYFINSSHNTYLTGHQLKGLSSCEAYVRALLLGYRCLEIDIWNGAGEPRVTHGHTLTSEIKLRDVLETIKAYAFDASPYPLILSLENHCSSEEQKVMAGLFKSIFGDMLATEDLCVDNMLPSPNQLKRKVILKGQPMSTKKFRSKTIARRVYSDYPKNSSPKISYSRGHFSQSSVSEEGDGGSSEEQVEIFLEDSMSQLIVYCCSVPYRQGESGMNCREMHSLGEGPASVYIERSSSKLLETSRTKLFRTYPRGSRVDSSNYNPMLMWKAGLQMAAINVQKPDYGCHVNQGFFRNNGCCGYVLKPDAMLQEGSPYQPSLTNPVPGFAGKSIQLEILSGQFLNRRCFSGSQVSVELEMVGVDADCLSFSTEACANTFNPTWKRRKHTFSVVMPSLCVLYVKVYGCSRANRLIYQNCFPTDSLKCGIRYIPMKTLTGVNRPEIGLFVKIRIRDVVSVDRDA